VKVGGGFDSELGDRKSRYDLIEAFAGRDSAQELDMLSGLYLTHEPGSDAGYSYDPQLTDGSGKARFVLDLFGEGCRTPERLCRAIEVSFGRCLDISLADFNAH
jgi:hypothetical protein